METALYYYNRKYYYGTKYKTPIEVLCDVSTEEVLVSSGILNKNLLVDGGNHPLDGKVRLNNAADFMSLVKDMVLCYDLNLVGRILIPYVEGRAVGYYYLLSASQNANSLLPYYIEHVNTIVTNDSVQLKSIWLDK